MSGQAPGEEQTRPGEEQAPLREEHARPGGEQEPPGGEQAPRGGETMPVRALVDDLRAEGDAARAAKRPRDAAVIYAQALRLAPDDAALHRLAADAFAHAGDAAAAERHYRALVRLAPDGEGEASLLLGRFFAERGRLGDALAAFADAAARQPDWRAPRDEIRRLKRTGLLHADAVLAFDATGRVPGLAATVAELRHGEAPARIAPELAPRRPEDRLVAHAEGVTLRQFGRAERSLWGMAATLRGLEAVRGVCLADTPIFEVQLLLDGHLIHRGAVKGGYRLADERDHPGRLKYVFNIWLDFGVFAHGLHQLECRCLDLGERVLAQSYRIVIAAPLAEADHPDSDALVTLAADDGRSPDAQVAARASMVRAADRGLLAEPPRTVLVQRVDQLGDVVVSVPALRRLRALLPAARLVGLLSTENADLAHTLGLFDEIVAVEFPASAADRRRVMPLAAQEALRERLAAYRFDLAIDLAEDMSSRPLLLLSGAPLRFGFPSGEMPALDLEASGATRDRLNRHEIVSHANKLLGFVEWLGAMLARPFAVVRREDLSPARLGAFGIAAGERFVVLHSGARLAFTRWPHHGALAALILARTGLKVVQLSDDPDARAALPADVARSDRFHLVEGRLPFDDLDALLSWCTMFVGNDSGLKHLAALRGAKVVSIHMARNNWNEWGQQGDGVIVSRRLPCAGCLIQHDPEECGRDFACIADIAPDQVFDVIAALA